MPIAANKFISAVPVKVPKARHAAILKVLAYFDIFQYPLTAAEIKKYLDQPLHDHDFEHTLRHLLHDQHIYQLDEFYSLHNNPLLALRRREGNQRAAKLMPRAMKAGRFLYQFPFVSAIGISGSLSKNFADERSDVDFFIITKANRLWIARTLMHLFKKLTFLTGHQHYFCMNYYIDETALRIEDENIYTALEIATLIPVAGNQAADQFFVHNKWRTRFFPNCSYEKINSEQPANWWTKKILEVVFNNAAGEWLDRWLMQITTRRWQNKNKRGQRNKNGHTMALLTGRHFARSNAGSFQEKVVAVYEHKLAELKVASTL